jgi:hypothetical protein
LRSFIEEKVLDTLVRTAGVSACPSSPPLHTLFLVILPEQGRGQQNWEL